jgi:hypothetical protein
MNATSKNFVQRNTVFAWLVLATCVLLLIPLVAMQFTAEVHWGPLDFAIMGLLIFVTGCLFVLLARKLASKYWPVSAVLLVVCFLYVWAELAVGIFNSMAS